MSCGFSRETLALHVEGDLPEAAAAITATHLQACGDCRRFLDQLRVRQSLLKSLRQRTVGSSECRAMRGDVMSIINGRRDALRWPVRIERAIVLGLRQPAYALAAFALVGIVSVSVLAQIRQAIPGPAPSAAVFRGENTMLRPRAYRDWILVGRTRHDAVTARFARRHNVYIDPVGYREYVRTGKFPEGTVMVWEPSHGNPGRTGHPHQEWSGPLASVKDSTRFAGGWGFFDFTGVDGVVAREARALPDSSGCRACHRRDAETDHVFTQFYPGLRSAGHGAQGPVARETAA